MNTIKVSATHARNNFFEILENVALGKSFIIEKDRRVVAEIVPHIIEKKRNKGLLKALDKASQGFNYSEKDNPLRRPGAADFLGRWDRDLAKAERKNEAGI